MPIATVRLYNPSDISGRFICWRLESDFCHATIQLGDKIYSATYPHVIAAALDNPEVAMPPRTGVEHKINLTEEQFSKALEYCKSMVGTSYDIISSLGWALRIESLQREDRVYCFEYAYNALAAAGLFPESKKLVTGDELLVDLWKSGATVF